MSLFLCYYYLRFFLRSVLRKPKFWCYRSAAFVRQRVEKQKKGAGKVGTRHEDFSVSGQDIDVVVPGKEEAPSSESLAQEKNDFLSTVRSLKRNASSLKNQSKARMR